ncbi:MAG: beta-ketoacyl-ACP synthase II [Proteobacteria bacterium]|jgi:3-oxoacyl-[acyl-carrier-protein] synthase II|nr:beta-ketoacyl-ACP synthase II [Desulfocapsa sp.]MBU3945778.1 beta-ketoacyl-ACP synthase II [Pseudomonadota bacterium]MCG2745424.1 beta-ketoacyl-ACP synthase II [Desulfobacteraceae bacterium]MBU4030070.1 beta-ketoacyl-ACP synthase II [Pseudomonadota bacterium]MBU4041937.1 beta-ketoacyl-ACP synthase II [Pseudomonadota bacterium]
MARRRVVVTGVGLVTPLGTGTQKTWENICAGTSGVGLITRFDTSDYAVKIAAEVKDFQVEDFIEKKLAKHLDLFVQYAIAAARMAFEDSGAIIDGSNCQRVGVITGCGMGGLPTIEQNHLSCLERGSKRISPFFIPMAIPNMPSGHISMQLGAKGPNLALSTACAAGTHAVGEAYRSIVYGSCDMVITGGTESVICPLGVGGFSSMKALSTRNDAPEQASRPFDKDRDGFVMSEGSGMLIIEELEHALKRGATIYAEITGYGASSDAYHIAAPPENGEGAARCMRIALADAGLSPEDIDYINAHGTSTPLNDRCETQAIKTVFGDHARKLAISSTKSMTGHMLGAAGGIEAAFTALSIREQIAPPTMNLKEASPECDLDYVPNQARKMEIRAAVSNSFGFGGTNGVIVMQRYND